MEKGLTVGGGAHGGKTRLQDNPTRVAKLKFDPKVGSRRTTKI